MYNTYNIIIKMYSTYNIMLLYMCLLYRSSVII